MAKIQQPEPQPQPQQQPTECPEGCCTGDEILCVSIPCPISIVLLGIDLQLELPCLRLSTQSSNLTTDQTQQLLSVFSNLLGNLGSTIVSE